MTVVDWYLIRHAPVLVEDRHDEGTLYVSSDEPADLSNGVKFDKLAAILPEKADWWVSPLRRTRETAQELLSRKVGPVGPKEDDRLVEQDFGAWHGLGFDQLWAKIKDLPAHNWSLLAADTCPPGGDRFIDIWHNVGEFMADNRPVENQRPQVMVIHAGIIRAIIGHIMDLSPDKALSFGLAPLSLTHIQYMAGDNLGGRWRLVTMNENFGEEV